ncbi:MAG: AAA family ATPase [Muribaculaceae bacterium]|nr:AAA family ATPase [Muribaculaceae bacterium]
MQRISTLILSDELSTCEVLKLFVSEFDELEILDCPQVLSDVYDKLSALEGKSLFLVDLSTRLQEKLDLILKVSKSCANCKILALSDNPSVDLIIRIMRAGAREFIPVPIIKNELFAGISKLISDSEDVKKNSRCKIISVFSNKGGIGKTSLAVNLALELSKTTKENVALIDLNFQMGDITTFLNLKPSFNISYMLENLEKINETFLLSTLERYKNTSLYVLADPPYFKQADNIKPGQISKLFNTLKDTFSYIVVDAESSFDGKSITALDNSDMVMLVSVANLPALRNTQRCLELFDKLGYDKNKTKIVINRYMENDEIKDVDVEKLLAKEIYWKVPNNYFAIMTAINKGVPVSEVNTSTNIAQSYKELARYISDNLYKQSMAQKFENILNK